MGEHCMLSKTQELEVIYTKIELILDIMISQIEKKKKQKRLSQIFKITKMQKYKNGKCSHIKIHKPYFSQLSRKLLHEIQNYHNSLNEISHSTSNAT